MEQLMEILKGIRPDVDFENERALITDGVLDSFDVVTIVAEINDTFDVDIFADDLVPENFETVSAIMALIQHYQEI